LIQVASVFILNRLLMKEIRAVTSCHSLKTTIVVDILKLEVGSCVQIRSHAKELVSQATHLPRCGGNRLGPFESFDVAANASLALATVLNADLGVANNVVLHVASLGVLPVQLGGVLLAVDQALVTDQFVTLSGGLLLAHTRLGVHGSTVRGLVEKQFDLVALERTSLVVNRPLVRGSRREVLLLVGCRLNCLRGVLLHLVSP
jgi:hypothetical protein